MLSSACALGRVRYEGQRPRVLRHRSQRVCSSGPNRNINPRLRYTMLTPSDYKQASPRAAIAFAEPRELVGFRHRPPPGRGLDSWYPAVVFQRQLCSRSGKVICRIRRHTAHRQSAHVEMVPARLFVPRTQRTLVSAVTGSPPSSEYTGAHPEGNTGTCDPATALLPSVSPVETVASSSPPREWHRKRDR